MLTNIMNDLNHKNSNPAFESQKNSLIKRKNSEPKIISFLGENILVAPCVYDTGVDTELMIESVKIEPNQTFCEIGCGTGAISLFVAKKCLSGVAVDINPRAIENAKQNSQTMKVLNVKFILSDCFENISEQFDVLICNPPYSNNKADNFTDKMFWDPENDLKKTFFKNASRFLKPNGKIYFGWANFSDIDSNLPFELAKQNNFTITNIFKRPSRNNKYIFSVIEFRRL